MNTVNWAELAGQDFQLPDGVKAAELLAQAFQLLGSADPRRRDGLAYPALALWLERGELDERLLQVGEQAIRCFKDSRVQARSFGALILAEVVSRDAQVRRLSPGTLRRWQRQWATWYVHENDLRAFASGVGWLHALAHGADVAATLARHPGLTRPQVNDALSTLLKRLRRVPTLPAQYEDDRIALAAFLLLHNPNISRIDQLRWLVNLRRLMQPAFGKPRKEGTAFTVQTARALLMFTHYGLKLPDGRHYPPSPELQRPLLKALRTAFHFAYPD